MGRRPDTVPARLGDRSWLVGLAALALVGGGVVTRATGGAEQAKQGAHGTTTTTTPGCEPGADTSSTTTTGTTPDTTLPPPCPADTTTTSVSTPGDGSSTTTASGPDTTAPGDPGATTVAPADSTAAPADPGATVAETTTTLAPAAPPSTEPDVAAPELPPTPPQDWPVRLISFPVAGPITYYDDWGACRGGPDCPRRHIGNDLIGRRLQPLLAANDGVVSHLVLDHPTAGWGLVIKDAEGWDYRYYHVNNDAPGTDDGTDPVAWRLAPGIAEGTPVKAGQVVAYLGDSGNSELSVPHLHFEIHQPDGSPIDPYRSLRFSEWAARCSVPAPGLQRESALMPPVNAAMADAVVQTSTGRGQFLLSLDGTVLALGDADSVGWSRHLLDDPPCPAGP